MFEKEKKLLKNTVKMYDETLETMKERGANPETISFVIEMRRQVVEQLKAMEDGDAILLMHDFKNYAPYTSNRFVLDFGVDAVKDYFVDSVSYDKSLVVTFRNSEDFFVPEYFEGYRYFDKVQLFLLNPIGVKMAVIEFDNVQVESVITDEFNYKFDDILKTHVSFTFRTVTHKTL